MPRYYGKKPNLTPFAKVLIDYMWNRRPPYEPPITAGHLAARLGLPRQTVSNWVNDGLTPPLKTILTVMAQLQIPLDELLRAYRDQGVPMPPGVLLKDEEQESEPQPRTEPPEQSEPSEQPQTRQAEAPSAESWDALAQQAETAMRQAGMSKEVVTAVVKRIREQQQGYDPMSRHQRAEHDKPEDPNDPGKPNDPDDPADSSAGDRPMRTLRALRPLSPAHPVRPKPQSSRHQGAQGEQGEQGAQPSQQEWAWQEETGEEGRAGEQEGQRGAEEQPSAKAKHSQPRPGRAQPRPPRRASRQPGQPGQPSQSKGPREG